MRSVGCCLSSVKLAVLWFILFTVDFPHLFRQFGVVTLMRRKNSSFEALLVLSFNTFQSKYSMFVSGCFNMLISMFFLDGAFTLFSVSYV